MRAAFVLMAPALLLAACDTPAPPVETEGARVRAEMEAATKTYADCISGQAETMPVADEAAGSLALKALDLCNASRAALVAKVAAFNKIGYPQRTPAQLDAVAGASVKLLDDDARQAAVITIVKRQTQTTNDADASATKG